MRKLTLFPLILLLVFVACQKEIDFEYNEVESQVVIEGRVTNEDVYVLITRSRQMEDSVKARGIDGATVTISADGGPTEQLVFDTRDGRYRPASGMKGRAGETYRLTVDFEGRHYEAKSTMPLPAVIDSVKFVWQDVLTRRLLVYLVAATDPEPGVRNYYWYRMDRRAVDSKVRRKQGTDPYRWNVFDDRGTIGGRIYRDIHCMMDKDDDEDTEEDKLKKRLFEGDTITLQLMTIDRPAFEYYQSLSTGQRMGANPLGNLSGGCLGYFLAGSVTRADTVRYMK